MAEEKVLLDIQINTEKVNANIASIKNNIASLKEENKKLAAESKAAFAGGLTKEFEDLNKKIVANENAIRENSKELSNSRKTIDLVTQANKAEAGSYEEVTRLLQIKRTELKLAANTIKQNVDGTFELTEEYKKQSAEVERLAAIQLQFDQGIKDGRTNVGNYSAAFSDALEKTGLFSGKLGEFREIFQQVKAGALTARDGFNEFKQGAAKSVEVINDWFTTTSAGNETITETKTGTVELGKSLETTGAKGVSSMSALRAAVASTGIGLIVIALALVINYLRQLDPVVEKVEQLFSGVGAAVTAIGKGIFDFGAAIVENFLNPLKLLETINPINVVKRFAGVAQEATRAGLAAAELTRKSQELEDLQIASIKTQSDLKILAEKNRAIESDRTRSTKERIEANTIANEAEKKSIEDRIRLLQIEADITVKNNNEARKNGTIQDDARTKEKEQLAALNELKAELDRKDIENTANSSKLRNKIVQDEISARIALLNEQLRREELLGRETTQLKKRIAREQFEAEISDTTLSNLQKLALREQLKNKILEIEVEERDRIKGIRERAQDISDNQILDGATREIVQEARALERKLEAIKGFSDEEKQLREKLKQESAAKIISIQQKYDQIELNEQVNGINNRVKIRQNEFANDQKIREAQLKAQLAEGKISQQEFDAQTQELKANALAFELALEEERQAAIIAKRNEFYENEKLLIEASNQTQLEKDKALAELLRTQRDENFKLDVEFQKNKSDIETQIAVDNEQKKIDASTRTTNAIRKNNELQRDAALSLLASTKDILAQDANIRKQYGAAIKVLALAEIGVNLQRELAQINANSAVNADITQSTRTILTIAALTRAAVGAVKVSAQEFAVGGFTDVNGYRAQNIGSHASGGFRSRPTLGLIGEKGTEYVAPAWQINQYPELFNILEQNRIGYSAMPFANGGFTQTPVIPQNIGATTGDIVAGVVAAISNVTIVTQVRDINTAQDNLATIVDGANI